MFRTTILLPLLICLIGCQSTGIKEESKLSIQLMETNGIKQYQQGNYEKAFNLLKKPASMGYKGSQYTMAFMFLKGHYVEQSTLLGMGWLGVATEEEIDEWSEQYQNFYNAASPDFKISINQVVSEYIARYGMKAQNITCDKGPSISSRAVSHVCSRSDRLSIVYDIELTESEFEVVANKK